jgi:hypothetical protein
MHSPIVLLLSKVSTLTGLAATLSMLAMSASAGPFFFSTGNPDGLMATASRPSAGGGIEIESADDFGLTNATGITNATFTGLITPGSNITEVIVEIYRVFPNESTFPPSGDVPTRTNSPSDIALASRDSAAGELSFTTSTLSTDFTANNSVLNGINPKPNQQTDGEGPVTGDEVMFNVTFMTPFDLLPDHYFFVPQVQLDSGEFYWLSAPKPIVAPGTPFPAGFSDLQSWIRNENLAPDWLRVGTDIVGPPPQGGAAPTFNAAFSLSGQEIPEPATLLLIALGLGILWWGLKRKP